MQNYDFTANYSNYRQPVPAPAPYATKPDFSASLKRVLPRIQTGMKKPLTIAAVMGMTLGVLAKSNTNAEQILPATNPVEMKSTDGDGRIKLAFIVKCTDGNEILKGLNIADDANYIIDLNGDKYTVFFNDLTGFRIIHNGQDASAIELSSSQYVAIASIAKNTDDANELSPSDIENLPEGRWGRYVVTTVPKENLPQGWTQKIIKIRDGNEIIFSVNDKPTANPNP